MMNKLKYAMWCLLILPAMWLCLVSFILKCSLNGVTWIQILIFEKWQAECEKYEDE